MFNITFIFEEGEPVTISALAGEKLLDVARKANVAIDAPCSGNGVCGKCRVRLVSGYLDAPINRHISTEEYNAGWRLACLAQICGDAEIAVPDIANAYRSRMKIADISSPEEAAIFDRLRDQLMEAGFSMESDLSFLPLDLTEPTLEDTMPDNERVLRAVEAATGVPAEAVMIPYTVLKHLSWVLRESEFRVKCVLSRDQDRILIRDVLPADNTDPIMGFALDLGTTSLAGVIVDLQTGKILAKASCGNGQIRYGADVINRIIESDKLGGRKRLQDAVVKDSIIPMLAQMYRSSGINPRRIYRMVLAGNTTMNHLLLGLHSDPIRMEPFVPSFFRTDYLYVRDIDLKMNRLAELIVAPHIGSYVGNATASRVISLPWTPTLILIAGILSSATALFLISQDGSINFINSNAHIPPHEKSPILNGAKLVVRDDSWCNQKGSTYPFIMFR